VTGTLLGVAPPLEVCAACGHTLAFHCGEAGACSAKVDRRPPGAGGDLSPCGCAGFAPHVTIGDA
jgi:hypothetical protein